MPRKTKPFSKNPHSTKRVVFLATPLAEILDVTGPFKIFARASQLLKQKYPERSAAYSVEVVSTSADKVIKTSCGLGLVVNETYRSVHGRVDTLLVAGGLDMRKAAENRDLLKWLSRVASHARRFGSICTGAFLLAEAGLLNGKRVATHWEYCGELARLFPRINVETDPIYICDGNVYTSAGVTAGMDLALALVEEDLGSVVALQIARELVLYLRRPGGQSQFSAALSLQASDRKPIREVQSWIIEHFRERLTVEALACRVSMSPRNFARVFLKETGVTPARFVEQVRIEAVRRRLEETTDDVAQIAVNCGFASPQAMRRVFFRVLRVAPTQYRARFRRRSTPNLDSQKSIGAMVI